MFESIDFKWLVQVILSAGFGAAAIFASDDPTAHAIGWGLVGSAIGQNFPSPIRRAPVVPVIPVVDPQRGPEPK